jgi:precorrin-2 dehydrogenase/sirohydrochlorin ferrochelatase
MPNEYMPVSLDLKNRTCLVVGGGNVALRKVETLLDYDTKITVIASDVHEKLAYHAEAGRIAVEKREYRSPEAAAFGLVISASDDKELNRRVYDDAKGSGALVNVVDDPPHCDFIFPAVLRRGCLTTSVSTDGKAPFMSGHLRLILENIFPDHWDKLMRLAAAFRTKVRKRWPDEPEKKNICYSEFLEVDWKRLLKDASDEEIEAELDRILEMPA